MRPLSFTKNIGGLHKVHAAIRRGYVPGISVAEFRKRCGLKSPQSLIVVEFFLCTTIRDNKEYVVHDTLVDQSLIRPKFDAILARLYFFAVNLAMPGERLREDQLEAGSLQQHILTNFIYANGAWQSKRLDKDRALEPYVLSVERFPSVRKWVNNYWYMMQQCKFVERPDGTIETFPDTWGFLALNLFFDRYSLHSPTDDSEKLASAAMNSKIQEMLGVDTSWLQSRVGGAADIFAHHEPVDLQFGLESDAERDAAGKGKVAPRPRAGSPAAYRQEMVNRVQRRSDNKRFIQDLYGGLCQISGTVLKLPDRGFSIDCAHIRPLGLPHRGPDDVGNMLSLSPTMHRLFDCKCVHIDPNDFTIKLLHGNEQHHYPKLFIRDQHELRREHFEYFNSQILQRTH
jgi:hypothetical protein